MRADESLVVRVPKAPKRDPKTLVLAALALVVTGALARFGVRRSTRAMVMQLLARNQMLQAMLAPIFLGGAGAAFAFLANYLYQKLISGFYCSVTVTNKDPNFNAVLDHISGLGELEASSLVATTFRKKNNTWKEMRARWQMGVREPPRMEFRPSNESTTVSMFNYRGKRIYLSHRKGETVTTGYNRVPMTMETLTLSTFGWKNSILIDLFHCALAESYKEETGVMNIFVVSSSSWLGGWEKALTKKPRPLESVVLDDKVTGVVEDARNFLKPATAQWYTQTGIPYRRGYLLHGPPGCGKTSLCQALAGELQLDICMLSLSNKDLDDNRLSENLREAPAHSLVLLEDVDAVFLKRAVNDNKMRGGASGSGVTFSGLLNAIDGVASQEGRIFFMTTNHIENLDAALIRPGRCDVKVEVGLATREQMKTIFKRFLPLCKAAQAEEFANKLPNEELSMAQIQGHLLKHRYISGGRSLARESGTRTSTATTTERLIPDETEVAEQQIRKADEAIERIPELLQAAKPRKVEQMSVYDHLRRLGLEQFAPLFEHFGYVTKSSLKGLDVETLKHWSVEIKTDPILFARLQRMFKLFHEDGAGGENMADGEMLEEYAVADLPTIKELFKAAYLLSSTTNGDAPSTTSLSSIEAGSSSGSSSRNTDTITSIAVTEDELNALVKRFCASLSRGGKGIVSVWQLNTLLALYPNRPVQVVEAAEAGVLTCGRSKSEEQVVWLSTWRWLQRMCLEKYSYKFEDAGYTTATQCQEIDKEKLLEFGVRALNEQKRILAIVEMGDDELITRQFLCPGRLRVAYLFRQAFPGCVEQADAFALQVTDSLGRGKVSAFMLQRHFEKYGGNVQQGDGKKEGEGKTKAKAEGEREEKETDKENEKEKENGKGRKEVVKNKGKEEKREDLLCLPLPVRADRAVAAALQELVEVEREPRPEPAKQNEPTEWVHMWLKTEGKGKEEGDEEKEKNDTTTQQQQQKQKQQKQKKQQKQQKQQKKKLGKRQEKQKKSGAGKADGVEEEGGERGREGLEKDDDEDEDEDEDEEKNDAGSGLEQYSQGFIDNHLATEEELAAPPILTAEELEDVLGVHKLGDRRRILRMLEALHKKHHPEEEAQSPSAGSE